jgi:predicted PurR-regulated permease PerM
MQSGDEDRSSRLRPSTELVIQFGMRTILVMIALVAGAYLLFRLPHVWLIILSAVVLATAIDKPVTALSERGLPRPLGILLLFTLLLGLLVLAVLALAPVVASDARALEREFPTFVHQIEQIARPFAPDAADALSLDDLAQAGQEHADEVARSLTNVGIGLGRSAFYVFVTFVVAYFLAAEPDAPRRFAERVVPAEHGPRVERVAASVHQRIGEWARGQVLIAAIFGALMGVGLRLLGVPFAWSIGVIAGILEVVPYVGGAVTLIIALFSAATVGLPQVIGVIILYTILVFVESHILAPLLYGRTLGLPPVVILVALLLGVELLGVLGALLAVPLTVIVWALIDEFLPHVSRPIVSPTSQPDERHDGDIAQRTPTPSV